MAYDALVCRKSHPYLPQITLSFAANDTPIWRPSSSPFMLFGRKLLIINGLNKFSCFCEIPHRWRFYFKFRILHVKSRPFVSPFVDKKCASPDPVSHAFSPTGWWMSVNASTSVWTKGKVPFIRLVNVCFSMIMCVLSKKSGNFAAFKCD